MPSKNASEKLASVMPPPYPDEYPKIVVPPPGPKAKEWNARDRAVVSQNLTPDYELVTERASGMVVEDLDGNRFLDFAAGISTVSTGHYVGYRQSAEAPQSRQESCTQEDRVGTGVARQARRLHLAGTRALRDFSCRG